MLSRIVFTLLFCCLANSVAADLFRHTVDSFETDQGIVTKRQLGEPEDFGNSSVQVLLDKKIVYEEKEYPFVYLNGFFNVGNRVLLIISLSEGGNACPAYYKIINIQDKQNITVTKEFGTCSDLIQARLEKNSLSITMPAMHPDNPNGNWEYHEGKLIDKNAKPVDLSENNATDLFYRKDEHKTIAGNFTVVTKDIQAGQTHITLMLENILLLEEQNFNLGSIRYHHPQDRKARFLVISLENKKNGCNAKFRIIELDVKGVKHMSPEFGNCGAYASFGFKNDGIRASFNKTSTKPYEIYLFKNGEIRQVR